MSGWWNWRSRRRTGPAPVVLGNSFGPYRSSRASASVALSPASGSVSSRRMTSWEGSAWCMPVVIAVTGPTVSEDGAPLQGRRARLWHP